MKNLKLIGFALVSVLFLGLYSCAGGTKTEEKEAVEEVTTVDEAEATEVEVADSVMAEEPEVMEAE